MRNLYIIPLPKKTAIFSDSDTGISLAISRDKFKYMIIESNYHCVLTDDELNPYRFKTKKQAKQFRKGYYLGFEEGCKNHMTKTKRTKTNEHT